MTTVDNNIGVKKRLLLDNGTFNFALKMGALKTLK
jgi:hypothetical protein